MMLGERMPPLEGHRWLIPPGPGARDIRATLIHFWSIGCPLCDEGLFAVARWRDRFGPLGLRTIAVFSPRPDIASPAAADLLRFAREREHIEHACIYDADGRLAAIMSSPYSPGYFVFDAVGILRHRQIGNTQLNAVESLLERLVQASAG